MIRLTLPFPPSVNRYWRHVGRRTLISRAGREFRERVCADVAARELTPMDGRLAVSIELHPRDRRRFDADNFCKGPLDALEHAGLYADDAQITHLEIDKRDPVRGGQCDVLIEPYEHYLARRNSLFELVCCAGCGRDAYRQMCDRTDPYCARCIEHGQTHAFPEDIDRESFDEDLIDDLDDDDDLDEDDWDGE